MSPNERAAGAALRWLGTPYRHQASRIGVGCDCLGLVRGVWRELYGAEPQPVPPYPRSPRDRAGASELLAAAEQWFLPAPIVAGIGALLLFRLLPKLPPRHCGILISNGRFIHAQERLGVIIAPLDANWRRKIHSTYQFPEEP